MIRLFVALILGVTALPHASRGQDPQVTASLDAESVTVGQPLTLRIKVLVPTWLPEPVVFPTIELPSLMVRLPERATGPISARVGGETWSGVQRAYRLIPLAAGGFALPDGEIVVTYADPDTTDPVQFRAPLPDLRFAATIPSGARGLDPPIIARGFTLTQEVEGGTDMRAGDAITRTITATIDGTTAVLIPALTPDITSDALRAYGKEPMVTDKTERGEMSGTRIETTTYIGQQAGTPALPEVSLDWFNLDTGAVETATLPATRLTVTGTVSPGPPLSPRDIALWTAWAAGAIVLAWLAWRFVRPPIMVQVARLRARYLASEHAAYRRVRTALDARDLSATLAAVSHWEQFLAPAGAEDDLHFALTAIGAARYGAARQADDRLWQEARRALISLRRQRRAASRSTGTARGLPPLNP